MPTIAELEAQDLSESKLSAAPARNQDSPAADESDPQFRADFSLGQLQRLADLLAVEDGYEPTTRDFVLPRTFKLSIVIPVYNEAATIQRVLANVIAIPVPKEVIIVDDASTDGTRNFLIQYECARDIHVILKPQNEGKGAALRTGFRRVSGQIVVVQDADLEYDPRDILPLIRPIICGQADVVYGSRFLNDEPQDRSWVHRLGNWLLTAASNLTTGLAITDMETCYKAFHCDVLKSFEIQQPRFGFEPEVTAKIARRKYRVCEVPIGYSARGYADGKKIGVADLFNALYCIVRYAIWD
jgi:glycosyltransferase involved in cell wall biosynthesis